VASSASIPSGEPPCSGLANGVEGGDDIAIAEGRTIVDGRSAIYAAFEPGSRVELDVPDGEALEVTWRLIRRGLPVGPSSGLNYRAA
jgi:cysteine synthase A